MLRLASPVEIGSAQAEALVLRNFHPPEPGGFVWSAGRWCEVEFAFDHSALPPRGDPVLTLDLDVFRHPPLLAAQDLFIYLNGLRLGALTVEGRQRASFRLRRATLQREANLLAIDAPQAARPADFGDPDGRLLGVKLFSLVLSPGLRAVPVPATRTEAAPNALLMADDRGPFEAVPGGLGVELFPVEDGYPARG